MTHDKSTQRATHSRWSRFRSQILPILFATLMVASLPAMTLAGGFSSGTAEGSTGSASNSLSTADISPSLTTQTIEDNTSYYDDFEDGNADGWEDDYNNATVVDDGFYGNKSYLVEDQGRAFWTDGPTFDSQENFELSGTYKSSDTDDNRVTFGIREEQYEWAAVQIDSAEDRIYLNNGDSDSDEYIDNSFQDQWADFRLQFDGGEMRLKVWQSGTTEPSDWQIEHEAPTDIKSQFFAAPGTSDTSDRSIRFDQIDAGGNAISGRVVDQNGEPVPNATVGGVGVNTAAINDTIEDKQAEAERLMEEAQNVELPEEWNPDYNPRDQIDESGRYLLAHEASDWGGGASIQVLPGSSIDDPVLQVDGDEELVFSVWDGTKNNALFENQYDGSFVGKNVEQDIHIARFVPGEGMSEVSTHESQVIAESTGGRVTGTNKHYGVKENLPTGIYHVYRTGGGPSASGYTIMVGDAEDQWAALETELENQEGELTERAEELQQNVESGLFERRTTTTDENGNYTLRMQQGVQSASVQAYRADGTVLPDITGPTFDDLRTAANGDYNGTYDLSPPATYDVPNEGVTLETYRTDQLPSQSIDDYSEFKNWLENQQLNETIDDIQDETDEKIDQLEREYLLRDYQGSRKLVETVPGAETQYLNSSEFSEIQNAADLNKTQLQTESDLMQESLLTIEADPEELIAIFETHASIIRTMPGAEEAYLENSTYDQIPDAGSLSESELETEIELMQSSLSEIPTHTTNRLQQIYETHVSMIETVPGAESAYLEDSSFNDIPASGSLSDTELAAETALMKNSLKDIRSIEPPEITEDDVVEIIEDRDELDIDPENITDAESYLQIEYPIPDAVDPETITPEIMWSDGATEPIGEEYWSVESGGIASQDQLVISGFPLDENDPAAFDIRIRGAGSGSDGVGGIGDEEGGLLDDRLSALNPSFGGSVPDVRAIDVSTLSPGQSDRVSMTMRTGDDSNYGSLENVVVYGPDGDQLTADMNGDSASFEANGAGEHFVRATVSDTTGGQFVQTFSLRALEQGRQNPPTVRAETATGDRVFAIAGDGLDDAEIRADDGQLEVDAIAPGGEIPSSVHVKPQAAMDAPATSIDVRVLEGSQEATVDTTVETVIHLDSLSDDAVVWRGEPGIFGQPLADGGTRYGEVMQRGGEDSDKVIIRTYSDEDGSTSLTINEEPNWYWDGPEHTIAQWMPSFSLPLLSVVSSLLGSLLIGGIGIVHRRRYPSR